MKKEIWIVEIFYKEELANNLETNTMAFEKVEDAERVFVDKLKEEFEDMYGHFEQYEIVDILDNGYYTDGNTAITIKSVTLQ